MKLLLLFTIWFWNGALFAQSSHLTQVQSYDKRTPCFLPKTPCSLSKRPKTCLSIRMNLVLMPNLKLGCFSVWLCEYGAGGGGVEYPSSVCATFFKYEQHKKNRITFDNREHLAMFYRDYHNPYDKDSLDNGFVYAILTEGGDWNFTGKYAYDPQKLVLQFSDTTFTMNLAEPSSWPSDYICSSRNIRESDISEIELRTTKPIKSIALDTNLALSALPNGKNGITSMHLFNSSHSIRIRRGWRGKYISMRDIKKCFPVDSRYFKRPYHRIHWLRFKSKQDKFSLAYSYPSVVAALEKGEFAILEIPPKAPSK